MINNTTISVTVYSSTGQLVIGSNVAITVAGSTYNLVTDATGEVITSLSLTNITLSTVSIAAVGYLSQTINYTVSPGDNAYTVVLLVDPAQVNKILTIDSPTGSPVPNVLVSVNGVLAGKTNSSGQVQIIALSGALTIQASCLNYQTLTITGTYTGLSFPSKLIILPKVAVGQFITFQTSPSATIIITGNDFEDTITTDSNGFATTDQELYPGVYSANIIKTNYQESIVSVTIQAEVTTYNLGILQSTLSPNPGIPATSIYSTLNTQQLNSSGVPTSTELERFSAKRYGISADPAPPPSSSTTPGATPSASSTAINTGGTSESEYPSEWIYPDAGSDGRYFTSSQARVYIGNLFVDEIDTIYYVYNNNRIPVYGYSSPNPDAFGNGRRIVQGQLSLNFVSEGYLYTILNEYQKKAVKPASKVTVSINGQVVNDIAALTQQQSALLTQQANGDTSAATESELQSLAQRILALAPSAGSSGMAQVKQILANATQAKSAINAIVQDVPFDVIINASAGGRTTTRKLKNCLLTSNEQVWDQSDNVIKDVYGFIGVETI
jgi:hypothetical protein